MSKEMLVIALGAWVIVLPYLGVYRSWLTVLLVLTGIALMVVGFLLRGEIIAHQHHGGPKAKPGHGRRSSIPFEENTAVVEHDYSHDASAPLS